MLFPVIDHQPSTQVNILTTTILCSLLPLGVITVIVIIVFLLWRCRQHERFYQTNTSQNALLLPQASAASPDTAAELRPLQLVEMKARGRFGCVWKAQMLNEIVAVKVFPPQDIQSWTTEKNIYGLSCINRHENILHFIGAERRGVNVNQELWLVTEFHERGSLYDYLKGSTVSWNQLVNVATSMSRGLAFLHNMSFSPDLTLIKPSLAHRDLKSKNVLLKDDFTACLADFGLALVLDHNMGDCHGQVRGTY